jgi:hypothetical protein
MRHSSLPQGHGKSKAKESEAAAPAATSETAKPEGKSKGKAKSKEKAKEAESAGDGKSAEENKSKDKGSESKDKKKAKVSASVFTAGKRPASPPRRRHNLRTDRRPFQIRAKLFNSLSPAAWLFSGWNCTPTMLSRPQIEANRRPYSVSPITHD